MEPYGALAAILFCIWISGAENPHNPYISPGHSFNHPGNSSYQKSVGADCLPDDPWWFAVQDDPRKFLYCDRRTSKLAADTCASVNNIPKVFDERLQRCVMPAPGKHRTAGVPRSSGLGEACAENTDCLDNMYCPAGTCQCVIGYVDIGRTCVIAISPGESGCQRDEQCRARWPNTECKQNKCECKLPDGIDATYESVVSKTKEGSVCIIRLITNRATSFCPLVVPSATFSTLGTAPWAATPVVGGPSVFPDNTVTCIVDADGSNCLVVSATADPQWTDMVLCVPSVAATTPPTATAMCCPNRAHTCMQPKPIEPQNAALAERRFWYNQATGGCEQFLWDGKASWANNFVSEDHCLSYCGGICRRGYTEVKDWVVPICDRGVSTTCTGNNQQCQDVASAGHQLCCPTKTYICGPDGGKIPVPANDPNGLPTATTPANRVSRWRYASGTCTSFLYTGWAGNYNNFGTQRECEAFCGTTCEQGEPLKINGNNQPCPCPSTYECKQGICCPRKQTVCVEPKMPGSCQQIISAYWYNSITRECEPFTYTGCGGNDNNFESYQACITYCREVKPEPLCIQGMADKDSVGNYYTCSVSGVASTCRNNYECYFDGFSFGCCPQRSYTCSLQRQDGSVCGTPTSRWYYDTGTRACRTFTYKGCDGNSNNFINRPDCERYCGVGGCPFGGEPFREDSGVTRICNSQSSCPSDYDCNTISSGSTSVSYCCKTRASICQQPPIQGTPCGGQIPRYYYNAATRRCTQFIYFGCGGNENNFATLSQCNSFCGSAACLAGEAAYMDPNSNRPLTCNSALPNACPQGYTCRRNNLNSTNVCCGSSDMGKCPTGERAYIEALTGDVRECQPGLVSSCPNDYFCRPNTRTGRYYCCASPTTTLCPVGKAPYRTPSGDQPVACFVSTSNMCPPDYSCQPTSTVQTQGYCCSINALCPGGGDFFTDPNTHLPRQCTVQAGFNTCPNTYTCKSNNPATPNAGYCCKSGLTDVCSIGQPFLDAGILRQCVPNQPPPCPPGYTCSVARGGGNLYYCCSSTTVPADGCPVGMIAFQEPNTGVIRACTFAGTQCPPPYSCQRSMSGGMQCCGLTGGCPSPNVAAINPSTGQPLVCTSGAGCPSGFQCLPANTGQMVCCTSGTSLAVVTARCPFPGQRPYIVPGTSQPEVCQAGSRTCPTGYECVNGGSGYICCSLRTQGRTQCWGTCTPDGQKKCRTGYTCQRIGSRYACCGSDTASCPSGTPFMYPGTRSPLQCHFRSPSTISGTGTDSCPVDYQCTRTTAGQHVCCPKGG